MKHVLLFGPVAGLLLMLIDHSVFLPPIIGKVADRLLSKNEHRPALNITSINLIGERHSGTKWIHKHLTDCFGNIKVASRYTRWKHWFQYDDGAAVGNKDHYYHQPNSSLVVAMFRDPYSWVDAMKELPHHSPNHWKLDSWKEFVTKPWSMERRNGDIDLMKNGTHHNHTCLHRYSFEEIVPCTEEDRYVTNSSMRNGVVYELNHNGSGQPYDSIVHLRRDKIKNFLLDVPTFSGVAAFVPIRYESVITQGT